MLQADWQCRSSAFQEMVIFFRTELTADDTDWTRVDEGFAHACVQHKTQRDNTCLLGDKTVLNRSDNVSG